MKYYDLANDTQDKSEEFARNNNKNFSLKSLKVEVFIWLELIGFSYILNFSVKYFEKVCKINYTSIHLFNIKTKKLRPKLFFLNSIILKEVFSELTYF